MCEKQLGRRIYLYSDKGRFVWGKVDGTNKHSAIICSLQSRLLLRTKQKQRLNDPATFPARPCLAEIGGSRLAEIGGSRVAEIGGFRLPEIGGSLRRVSASSKQGLSFLFRPSSATLLSILSHITGQRRVLKPLHHALP
jgi:hypothetical protein